MAETKLRSEAVREIAPDIPEGLERGLRNYWYPILQSEELPHDRPVALTALGENLVVWRDADGRPQAVIDVCPHRAVKLSTGRVLEGQLQCAFHGLRFDGGGRCVLIPWDTENRKLMDEVRVRAFPAEELGGYVWAYIGDAEKFPPPPLADEVPEELSDPDNFIWFRLPTEIWEANWLLTIDGGDAYHAVTLHADSQSSPDQRWQSGRVAESRVPLEDRRVEIVDTPHGIRGVSVDRDGKRIHHGHLTREIRGERVALPGIHTNPISPALGAEPYAARLWQFPIDAERTWIVRFLSWRASTDEERAQAEKIFTDIALPRLERVAKEDAMMSASQADLVTARANEFLFEPDMDLVRIRRRLKDAFLSQIDGERVPLGEGALAYPA
jgi:phenylpropionate dioxygenase-like ring-hydroxylating dioxygenase large terminal subunit